VVDPGFFEGVSNQDANIPHMQDLWGVASYLYKNHAGYNYITANKFLAIKICDCGWITHSTKVRSKGKIKNLNTECTYI